MVDQTNIYFLFVRIKWIRLKAINGIVIRIRKIKIKFTNSFINLRRKWNYYQILDSIV